MSRALAGLDRVIIALIGLLLLAVGVWAVAFAADVPAAHRIGDWYDPVALESFLGSRWYPVALVALAVVLIVLVPWWIVANLRPRAFNRMTAGGADRGTITVATTKVADATADTLKNLEQVKSVQRTTRMDRRRPTMTWTVVADPRINLPKLTEGIEQAERDVRGALPDLDVDTRFLVELSPVRMD